MSKSKKKKEDTEPLLSFEVGKGWKKYLDKLTARSIAVIIVTLGITYFLVEFLRTSLNSSLQYNPNLLVIVIASVLLTICFLANSAIGAFSKKNGPIEIETNFYSPVHSMIIQINAQIPHERLKGLTGGMWVNTHSFSIDFQAVSQAFTHNINKGKFNDKDFLTWTEILKEVNEKNAFWLSEARQKWFDDLEARFNRQN